MGDPGPRDIRQTLARPGQNPPHAPSRHHGDASGIPSRLVFNYADVMARGAPRPQAHPGEPRQVIRHATVISETHLGRRQRERLQRQRIPFICPGIQAYLPFMDEEYWSGKPNKQVKIYDPHKWAQFED